jgi:hypothetical protein
MRALPSRKSIPFGRAANDVRRFSWKAVALIELPCPQSDCVEANKRKAKMRKNTERSLGVHIIVSQTTLVANLPRSRAIPVCWSQTALTVHRIRTISDTPQPSGTRPLSNALSRAGGRRSVPMRARSAEAAKFNNLRRNVIVRR